jgi:Txe/YoeB family toxin of Txe-Axe toxin-antitoxin module
MKNIGIWLDKEKAFIVTIENGKEKTQVVSSEIEHYHISGGSGTRFKGGPQDVVQDSKFLEREKHQLKAYFKKIVDDTKDADALLLFGPAGTNEKFKKEIDESYSELSQKVLRVERADSMTENQIKALVRDVFNEI